MRSSLRFLFAALVGLAAAGTSAEEIRDFAADHDRIYVVEQNQSAQMRQLLMVEAGIPRAKLISLLNYDGRPLAAEFIRSQIMAPQGQGRIAAE